MSIVFISYPSGGFGNFLYYALTEFADRTVKVPNLKFKFSANGNSHDTYKYTNTWLKDPSHYRLGFDCPEDQVSLVLCDNGITNDSYTKLRGYFNNPTILRINIDYNTRPVVYQTCVVKAMKRDFQKESSKNVRSHWPTEEDYSIRENYTLLYHNWPFKWEPDSSVINISLEQLITSPVETIKDAIHKIKCNVINEDQLVKTCAEWVLKNKLYFDVYYQWAQVECALQNNQTIGLEHISDLHTQGYINYRIEKLFNRNIPVYDFKNWFSDTSQILNAFA